MKNHVRLYRLKNGLTQTELAFLTGLSQNTISNLENDIYHPSVVNALKISQVLHQPVEKLFELNVYDFSDRRSV